MRILHVVAGVQRGGGIGESVPRLCKQLAQRGHDVTLAALDLRPSDAARDAGACGVKLALMKPTIPAGVFFSLELMRLLPAIVRAADIVHVHSNWTFPVWWACHLAIAHNKPLLMSPRGCLEPERLRRSAIKKKVAGCLFDRRYLRRAAVLHATAESEAAAIRQYLGTGAQPCGINGRPPQIVVVPNGVDAASFAGECDREIIARKWPECRGKRILLYLSRIHPIKGLPLLIEAWGQVSRQEWQLLIIGEDENGHQREIRKMAEGRGVAQSVTFGGALYGAEKAAVMKASSLFVLPSHNENFGIVVAEALACGVPVIATKGAPWAELLGNSDRSFVHYCDSALVGGEGSARLSTNEQMNSRTNELARLGRAGWWTDIGAEPLAVALREAMSLTDEERRAMGENGRRLVERKYRWETVAERMEGVYSGIVSREP